tara:strand:+ start:33 stop:233 length:201 start_codon:yes stop_codon:yes gene_type:complete
MSWELRLAKIYPFIPKDREGIRKYLLIGAIICSTGDWICKIFPLFFIVWAFNWILFPIIILIYLVG